MIKNIFLSGIALVAMSLLTSCQKEMADNSPNTRPLTAQEEKTVASSNDFAFRSFAQLSETEGPKNVFISPLSISMSLGMAYNGADGETKEAMRQALGFTLPSDEEINKSFKDLDVLLKGIDRKVVFTSANSLWHSKEYKLQAPFIKTNQTYFDATVQGLDFSSPAAKDQINNWVKSKTNGKIEKIVDEVRREHILFLINAIYFKGTWTYPFDKTLTKPEPFYLENGNTITPAFMTMKDGEYLHYQDDQVQLIDLPYGNEQYSMTILVPGRDRRVQDVAQELSANRLATLLEDANKTTYELHMPKFKLEYSKELNDMLKQLGMGIAFGNQADFSRMVEGQANLAISEVKHKSFVEVNEEGTEAAAATSTGIMVTSLPPSVRIDRPFVFMIREKSSNAILFIGKLMQPE
ncbi:serpin family protein [uncultured Pontibacter sp.]|uniref:serpin family protein n=1 Tax=uncultured Pontibacter sp. TaxID=453356 RepID=UPI002637B2EE|nr:serpin family protein [uncultured Pontibacter sp.]